MRASSRRATHSVVVARRCSGPAARSPRSGARRARPSTRDAGQRRGLGQRVDRGDARRSRGGPRSAARDRGSSPGERLPRVLDGARSCTTARRRRARAPDRGPRSHQLVPQRPPVVAGRASTSELSRSWRSSAVVGSGVTSSRTCSIAVGLERADRREVDVEARAAACTALVRRFWNSSSSRNAYGRAVMISCASTDASVVSTQCTVTSPDSMRSSSSRTPSTSSASCSVSLIVWRTRTWSGISIGPVTFSWHAAACGNTAAMRSSASMRWIGGGFLRPLRNRRTSSDRLRFQRQRARNIGESRIAWRSVSSTVLLVHVARHLVEREAVVRAERQHDRVVAGRGLQLEVEGAAELLAQREPERRG